MKRGNFLKHNKNRVLRGKHMYSITCLSDNCSRKSECAHYHENNPSGFARDYYYSVGFGSVVNNEPDFWACGEHGGWLTFRPLNE